MSSKVCLLSLVVFGLALGLNAGDEDRPVRILVRVEPRDLGKRAKDEMPAEFRIASGDLPAKRRLDPATLEVVRWDADAGKPIGKALPLRWYDDAIPYDFPDYERYLHSNPDLKFTYTKRPRWGDYYNLLGEGAGGRLVWTHTQERNEPAVYSVSYRLLPEGKFPTRLAPRGLVGDGSHRCAAVGNSSTSLIHSRVTVADWDGDGLPDLLVGGGRGQVISFRNTGSKNEPKFGPPRLVMLADGNPLDSGWSAAPCAVDWDGDGLVDLLVGGDRNRAVFYRNEGTNKQPKLVLQGFLTVGDKPLELPITPVPKSPKGVFTLDYYPILDAVDWNGDGKLDLLAGGYITGRVYLYENVGTNKNGSPKLAERGPLEADGKPLNVGDWSAAPTAADFDGDGDLDLICGNIPMAARGEPAVPTFLRYYENVGTRKAPRLVERPFPKKGEFPHGSLTTPRAVDLNGDGLVDLVVSASENVYLFFNVGTKQKPVFAVHNKALPSEWGSAPLPTWGVQFLDYNSDGKLDLLSGLSIYVNKGNDQYQRTNLLQAGNKIDHPAPHGDRWTFTQLADLDGDGKLDLLYGTHEGNVWLHRNLGGTAPRFDEKGERLKLADDKPLHVGPVSGQKMDFHVLQGSRTTLAIADFDGNELLDLVVGDTYGKVRLYLNIGDRKKPKFAAPVELGDMKIRTIPFAADWDGDGKHDIIGSSADGKVWWWRNVGKGRFDKSKVIEMPAVCYSPFAKVVDWNGDGDMDLLVGTGYGFTCWFDRSFLEKGYAVAKRLPRK